MVWKEEREYSSGRVLHEEGSLGTTRLRLSWVNRNTARAAYSSLISRKITSVAQISSLLAESTIYGTPDIDRRSHAQNKPQMEGTAQVRTICVCLLSGGTACTLVVP